MVCPALAFGVLVLSWMQPAAAAIEFIASSSAQNDGLPTNGSAGALTIPRPVGISAGQALIASIAARPRSMTVTVPSGWVLMTSTQQTNGGTSTAPGGMNALTYYKIVTTSEPASYTWTFANPSNQGGSAVGGMLAFSGIDTSSGNPIDNNGAAWSSRLTNSGLTHGTTSVNAVSANTLVVSSISFLSASTFAAPTGISGLSVRVSRSAPTAATGSGTTLQMATAMRTTAGATGASQAVASNEADHGVGHLMVLQPSVIDPALTVVRSGVLNPGGAASYTLTARNLGSEPEPGALTIVNTLPASLSYVSASGSGWSCGAAGQVVTCSRAGAVAAGASAPTLTLNVNVMAGISGAVSYTATLSGTGGDGNTANNTIVDNYVIPSTTYAYYRLNEATWGSIVDSSGNNRNASVLGTATPTGTSIPSPPGYAVGNASTGTCGAARVPNSTAAQGIDTGIDPNALGPAGTISFWYASSTNWNDGNARLLFDASNDLGASDRHFFVVKDGGGVLRFSLKDSAGTTSTAATVSYGYAANTWHHIAVTWNLAGNRLRIYVDGVEAASSTTVLNGSLGNMATLYVGSRRMAGVTGTPTGYTSNSAHGYIDELRLYALELSALEVDGLADLVNPCTPTVNHYQLSLNASSLACVASTLTVTACLDTSAPCTNPVTTINGQTATLATSAGTLGATSVSFNPSGVATTTLSHAAAANGASVTVTLAGESTAGANARRCCQGGSCSTANSCVTAFNTAGFIIASSNGGAAATLPTQTAGTGSGGYVLRAVRSSTTTQACEAAITGVGNVNWSTTCNNPTTCSAGNRLTLTGNSGVAVAGNANGSSASSTAVAMTFDANGNAPFSFNYADVGQITLNASRAAGGSLLTALNASSNAFVVKPAGFTLSAIRCTSYTAGACATTAIANPGSNPGASTVGGTAFIPAGQAFSATVTAVDAGGSATPNYGRETSAEGVRLTAALVAPGGGNLPALSNPTAFGAFSSGVATGTTFAWGEVGAITLSASVADSDYLGTGNVAGTTSGTVGRFYANHLTTAATPACSASFTYAGQAFTGGVTARNAAGTALLNYGSATFAKAVTLSDGAALGVGSFSAGTAVAASAFTSGVAAAAPNYGYTSKLTGPHTLVLRAVDADGASSSGQTEGATVLRSGRLRVANGFGRESAALQLTVQAEYWSGSSWLLNGNDSCTSVASTAVALGNVRTATGAAGVWTTSASAVSISAGSGTLTLAAPSASSTGSIDLALNLGSTTTHQSCAGTLAATTGAALAWLRSQNGSCAATFDRDPMARASFGIFAPESRRTVHARELF